MDEKDLRIQDQQKEIEKLKKEIAEYEKKCKSFSLELHNALNDKAVLEQELKESEEEQERLESLYVDALIERDNAIKEARYWESIDEGRQEREIYG